MSSQPLHVRSSHRIRSACLHACAALLLGAAGCSAGGLGSASYASGDAAFGSGADMFPSDGGLDGGNNGNSSGASSDRSVRVRLVQGVVNLGTLHVCHDPDLTVQSDGPIEARELGLVAGFGQASDYVYSVPMTTGTLTFHRDAPVPSDAGVAAGSDAGLAGGGLDAGLVDAGWVDAGFADAGVRDAGLTDAGLGDGGLVDAGKGAGPGDAAADAAVPYAPCDPRTVEATVVLPVEPSWLNPETPPTPTAIAKRGLTTTLENGAVTLLGSGLALDESRVEARAQAARDDYLTKNPKEFAAADQKARSERDRIDATLGPRFLPAAALPQPSPQKFALSLAHLIPDVPSEGAGTGSLRLCITVGTIEQKALPSGTTGYAFRDRTTVATDLDPDVSYRFRVFTASKFDAESQDCATTSLAPVADTQVPKGRFEPGRSYTLAILGALAPDAICAPTSADSLVRAGCPQKADQLGTRILVLDD